MITWPGITMPGETSARHLPCIITYEAKCQKELLDSYY